jgi:RND family efflux transporter MFP subunit
MRVRFVATALTLALAAALGAAACSRPSPANGQPAEPQAVKVGAENLHRVEVERLRTGPVISGTLKAEREASLRAEVAGSVLETPVEEGQRVARGAVLVRIDASAQRDAVLSAKSAVRSAEQQVVVARRNAERAEALLRSGAIAEREAEVARWNVMNAEAGLADARSRATLAQEQLSKTVVTAPFAGIVAKRSVAAGDTVAPGSELVTLVDPQRLELEATVPAQSLRQLTLGTPVEFTVAGHPDDVFAGTIERINPVADPTTRQVQVYVSIPNPGESLVAGLYAEGRVATMVREALALPEAAIDRSQGAPAALRVAGGKVERVTVTLGIEDPEAEAVEVVAGLAEGDLVLVGAARGISPGTPVELQSAAAAAPATGA